MKKAPECPAPSLGQNIAKPSAKDEWKLKVNAQYQEAMKTAVSLALASLVLPTVLLKTFMVAVKPGSPGITTSAYLSWFFLLASLASAMLFYWASAKFVKAVCGGYDENSAQAIEDKFEKIRDASAWVVVGCFFAGIISLLYFFFTLP